MPDVTVQPPHSEQERHALYRRCLTVVVISQVLGGAGLAAGITVGALLAQDMIGGEGAAGLPTALFTLGSALAAFLVGRYSQREGRRIGLTLGFLAGAVGAAGIVLAALIGNPVLLFASLLVYGAGTATNLQARYAATDLATPQNRATAVSVALVSTTFGAVAGPNLVEPLGDLATSLGLPALTGPFLLGGVAYALAGLVLHVFLRPDPLLVAQALARAETGAQVAGTGAQAAGTGTGSPPAPEDGRGVVVGATIMVITQVAMVAIMTMTPIHLRHHEHGLGDVGFVIGMHVGAMFLPSLVTGRLVDRLGRIPMAIAAAVTLLAAGLVAALAPGDSLLLLTLALVLLGLGWNFGLISGTALIIDSTVPARRAATQGSVDVLIALAGASSGVLSGLVVQSTSFAVLSLGGGCLALALLPVLAWHRRKV